MEKRPTCDCLQEAAEHNCEQVDFFYNGTSDMEIECSFYNATSEVQEDIDLVWNFCPQCGKGYEEVEDKIDGQV